MIGGISQLYENGVHWKRFVKFRKFRCKESIRKKYLNKLSITKIASWTARSITADETAVLCNAEAVTAQQTKAEISNEAKNSISIKSAKTESVADFDFDQDNDNREQISQTLATGAVEHSKCLDTLTTDMKTPVSPSY